MADLLCATQLAALDLSCTFCTHVTCVKPDMLHAEIVYAAHRCGQDVCKHL